MNELIFKIALSAFGILYTGIIILAIWWNVYLPLEDLISRNVKKWKDRIKK